MRSRSQKLLSSPRPHTRVGTSGVLQDSDIDGRLAAASGRGTTSPLPIDPHGMPSGSIPSSHAAQHPHDAAVGHDDDVAARPLGGHGREHVVGEAGDPPVEVADGLAAWAGGVGVGHLLAVDPGDGGRQDPRRGPLDLAEAAFPEPLVADDVAAEPGGERARRLDGPVEVARVRAR